MNAHQTFEAALRKAFSEWENAVGEVNPYDGYMEVPGEARAIMVSILADTFLMEADLIPSLEDLREAQDRKSERQSEAFMTMDCDPF